MRAAIDQLRQTRENLIKCFERHEKNRLVVPDGYKNNLLWNFAHCIVTQQILCYKMSNNKMVISDDFVELFKKGTSPSDSSLLPVTIEQIKDLALMTTDRLDRDYQEGIFRHYVSYKTSYGVELNNIDDAIIFNNIHEGLHLGYMMAMVKSL